MPCRPRVTAGTTRTGAPTWLTGQKSQILLQPTPDPMTPGCLTPQKSSQSHVTPPPGWARASQSHSQPPPRAGCTPPCWVGLRGGGVSSENPLRCPRPPPAPPTVTSRGPRKRRWWHWFSPALGSPPRLRSDGRRHSRTRAAHPTTRRPALHLQ